ncbi:glycosyltransferase family 25 protein [Aurantimonas endophytica]|uniref:Glycosyl transferase family 25 n=1 Tax=Aurantimonas endophytica TaxID=1522175 RepID=A0A7W6MMS0_9HYPH|nr:glycosyltransferase family 25 protein [Aurantimonas endophytica]MBB4001127.1 glycosyl transferase family 25 [Aurantimonas endophytica]MCO6403218.1 hypothetical protein [Aurantimonas endophytica]
MADTPLPAFFINLDRAVERRAFMERQARRLGFALERIRALEAADVDEATYATMSRRWQRPITRIEIAVLLSHAQLWERAAAGSNGLVVFEDDAVLSPRLTEFLRSAAPTEWDNVNLEWYGRRKYFRRSGAVRQEGTRLTAVAREKTGTAAYYVSPGGARKLLAALATQAAPADAFMYQHGRLRIAQVEPALAVQAHILAGEGIDPGIATVTQIHQPRQRLTLQEGSIKYRARRFVGQLALIRYQLGRLGPLVLRRPEVDLDEFRQVGEPGADLQSRSSIAQSER